MNRQQELKFVLYKAGMKVPKGFKYKKGHRSIIDFFNKKAKSCTEEYVSKIFIIQNNESSFVGFTALSICSIGKKLLRPEKARGMFERPAIRIGQLIVDEKFHFSF